MSITILQGDCLEQLRALSDASVQCCVTSPPYWGLRDYGHEGQIGLEKTPEEYVAKMVAVFREVRRVLKDDGTLWLNLGDSYSASGKGGNPSGSAWTGYVGNKEREASAMTNGNGGRPKPPPGYKPKDLVGIPWMVAFALRTDGWYLRSDIIWSKPNPMPESVTDRPTKAHEYIFLLSKSQRYFYDAAAIAEQGVSSEYDCQKRARSRLEGNPSILVRGGNLGAALGVGSETRNKRTVWTVPTCSYSDAHFATYPPDLIKPCILAGSRTAGKRCDCDELIFTPTGTGEIDDPSITTGRAGMNRPRRSDEGTRAITRRAQREYAIQIKNSDHIDEMAMEAGTAFEHYVRTDRSGARPLPQVLIDSWTERGWLMEPTPCDCPIHPPDTVLDPFGGSGTTGMVALELGRQAILIELNPDYIALIERRTNVTPGLAFA